MIISAVLMALLFVIGIALKLVVIVLLAVPLAPLSLLAPYKKLDEDCKVPEYNSDLDCEFTIIEKYSNIRYDEIYFLDNRFDELEPFSAVSPVSENKISKKDNTVRSSFLYIHSQNYEYLDKDICELYDTDMNLVAKIKFNKIN